VIRRLVTAAATTGLVAASTAGIVTATATPALAVGSVANSCAVIAPVQVWKQVPRVPGQHTGGVTIEDLPCGSGTSGVWKLTVEDHPFFVRRGDGSAPFCMDPGQFIYPSNRGIGQEMIVTPTVSCSNGRAS